MALALLMVKFLLSWHSNLIRLGKEHIHQYLQNPSEQNGICLKSTEDSTHSFNIPWLSFSKTHNITPTRTRVCKAFGPLISQTYWIFSFCNTKENSPHLERNQTSHCPRTFSFFILNHHCESLSHCFSSKPLCESVPSSLTVTKNMTS